MDQHLHPRGARALSRLHLDLRGRAWNQSNHQDNHRCRLDRRAMRLTAVLAILIAVNALIVCIKENPHRRKRKEAEKLNRDLDNLTPLDARNSLLMEPMAQHNTAYKGAPFDAKGPLRPSAAQATVSSSTARGSFTRKAASTETTTTTWSRAPQVWAGETGV